MDGYKKQLKIYSLPRINYLAIIIFFVTFIGGIAVNFVATDMPYLTTGYVWADIILSLGLIAVGIFSHEVIHGLSAVIFGKCGGADLRFGMKLKDGLFFCHCKKPITINAYRIMLIMPFIITGLIPYIITVFFGGIMLIAVFAMLMAGAAGDIVMLCGLAKQKNGKNLVIDHPDAVAYYLLYKEDELPPDFVETTEEDEKRIMEENEKKTQERTRKGMLLKTLGIGIFCALVVLALYVMALVMKIL